MNTYLWLIVVSSSVSAAVTWLLILTESVHLQFTGDPNLGSPQKVHDVVVPRVGGIAVILGMIAGSWLLIVEDSTSSTKLQWTGVALLPIVLAGLWEDLTKNVSTRGRLLASFISAAIIFFALELQLPKTGWEWFDTTASLIPGVTLFLILFFVGSAAHASNLIDGLNGLSGGFGLLCYGILAWISHQVDAHLLLSINVIMIGSLLGFIVFNYPKGRIFLGDSGAYLLGFVSSIQMLLLIKQNDEILIWTILFILAYPLIETAYTIYRRLFFQNKSIGQPDAQHLHAMLYRYLLLNNFYKVDLKTIRFKQKINSLTSLVILAVVALWMLIAVFWWRNSLIMVVATILFVFFYIGVYNWLSRQMATQIDI